MLLMIAFFRRGCNSFINFMMKGSESDVEATECANTKKDSLNLDILVELQGGGKQSPCENTGCGGEI